MSLTPAEQHRSTAAGAVAASLTGAVFGAGMTTLIAFSVFMQPMSEDLHAGRGALSLSVTLLRIAGALSGLVIGGAVDRVGVRKVVLPLTLLSGILVALLAPASGSLFGLYALFALIGLLNPGITPYSKLLSGWFSGRRGLALGSFGVGVFICAALTPQIGRVLLQSVGWRNGFIWLGGLVIATLPVLYFLLRESPEAAPDQAATLEGVSPREAWTSRDFWLVVIALGASLFTYNALMAHDVSLFRDRQVDLKSATLYASEIAIGGGLAQLIVGWLLDRFDTPRVILPFAISALAGLVIIDLGHGPVWWTIGALLLGLGSGGETSMTTYFVGRFFGLKRLSQIYASIGAVTTLTVSFSPVLIGALYDTSHSYATGLRTMEAALLIACIGFAALGPYRFAAARSAG